MKICGYEKFSLLDYDNYVTCTIFTKGCNFKCPFCQNSSLVLPESYAREIPADEIIEYLEQRKKLVDAVCISGGEPTLQPDLEEFIIKIKNMGYKIKLDTNGYRPEIIQRLLGSNLLDYIAMDIKNSLQKYSLITDVKNLDLINIQQSVKLIIESGIEHEFRTTLINEFHTEKDLESIAVLIKGAKNYVLQKFVDNGECIQRGLTEFSKEKAENCLPTLRKYIKNVKLRGY